MPMTALTKLCIADRIRREIHESENHTRDLKDRLEVFERACKHEWSKPEYVPIVIPAFHDPGDPPGTMGVDRQLPFDHPEKRIPQWVRTCSLCGKTETTQRTEKRFTEEPRF